MKKSLVAKIVGGAVSIIAGAAALALGVKRLTEKEVETNEKSEEVEDTEETEEV